MPSPMDQTHGASDVNAARRDDLTRGYRPAGRTAGLQTVVGVVVLLAIVVAIVVAVA